MPLLGFNAVQVNPGDPLTAQAWNELVTAVGEVYAELTSRRTLRVTVNNTGLHPADVRVTATHAEHGPVEGVRPVAAGGAHVLAGLRPGSWTLTASTPGFQLSPPQAFVVPEEGEVAPLEITLSSVAALMPDVFGLVLSDALGVLEEAGVDVEKVYDVTGAAFVPDTALGEYSGSRVLFFVPDPGTPVPAGSRAGLVIGASLQPAPSVVMPDLTGKTLQQAKTILEQLGLVLKKPVEKTVVSQRLSSAVIKRKDG